MVYAAWAWGWVVQSVDGGGVTDGLGAESEKKETQKRNVLLALPCLALITLLFANRPRSYDSLQECRRSGVSVLLHALEKGKLSMIGIIWSSI
jgi:hypothetical protein